MLPTGKLLVAGGSDSTGQYLASTELYDVGLGFDFELATGAHGGDVSRCCRALALVAGGSGFRGISEASGGNGAQNSSSNYPLVQLRNVANEQTRFLLSDPQHQLVGHRPSPRSR